MTYANGIVNSATPGPALMTALDAIIQAHPAWEFVEEVTSGTDVSRIYKCLGAVNGWGDFYVAMRRTSDTGSLGFALAESWNAATKLLVRYAPADSGVAGNGSYSALAADGSVGAVGKAPSDATVLANLVALVANTAMPYYISVTNDRICVAILQQSFWYVGLYESITDIGRDPVPLINLGGNVHGVLPSGYNNTGYMNAPQDDGSNFNLTNMSVSTAAEAPIWGSGTYTRQLFVGAGTQTRSNFWAFLQNWTPFNFLSQSSYHSGNVGVTSDYFEPISGKWLPARVMLGHQSASRGKTSPDIRGWLKDCLILSMYGYNPVNGDEIVVDGVTYTRMGTARRRLCDFWIPQAA